MLHDTHFLHLAMAEANITTDDLRTVTTTTLCKLLDRAQQLKDAHRAQLAAQHAIKLSFRSEAM